MTIENLRNDVREIYSSKHKEDQNIKKEYTINDQAIIIIYNKSWHGKAASCGIDMSGSAIVTMSKKNPLLERTIREILEEPQYFTFLGIFPIVSKIEFNFKEDNINSPIINNLPINFII